MSVTGMEIEIVDAVIVAMVIFYLKHIGNKFINSREKNKRFSIWMKYLQIDTDIDKCVNSFEEIISEEAWPIVNQIMIYLGFIAPVIILGMLNISSNDLLESFIHLNQIYIILLVLFFIVLLYSVDKTMENNLLINAHMIEIRFKSTKFLMFNSVVVIILMSMFLPLQQSQTFSDFKIVEDLLLIFIASIIGMEIIHKNFVDKVKTSLNVQHMADYPFIHITTKEADFAGIIQDVFNKILLILDDNGRKTIVEWNEITTMELIKEASSMDNSPPPSSQEKP